MRQMWINIKSTCFPSCLRAMLVWAAVLMVQFDTHAAPPAPLPCFHPGAYHLRALPGPAPQIILSQQVTYSDVPPPVWQLSPQQRDYEIARVRGILAQRLDRDRTQLLLESQIRIARGEVEAFRRLQQEYAGFNRFVGGGNPFPVSEEQMRLNLTAAQEKLRILEWEQGRFDQFGQLQGYLRDLEAAQIPAAQIPLPNDLQLKEEKPLR
ncbi:MAG: hypothetical protein SFX18_15100 [Pirellulales bacterium]|nr:hypothetical protein [Pirellulales bacterium]